MVDFKIVVSGSTLVVVRIGIGKTSKPSRMGNVSAMVGCYQRRLEVNR